MTEWPGQTARILAIGGLLRRLDVLAVHPHRVIGLHGPAGWR